MRDVVTWCFMASIAMSMISAIMPTGDFAGSIFGFMFWISGWIIACGRIRYGSQTPLLSGN